MKVRNETMVYCLIAFLLGYFFRTSWSSLCRCKSVEGWAVDVVVDAGSGKEECQDNSNWVEQNHSACGSLNTWSDCMASLPGPIQQKIYDKYSNDETRATIFNINNPDWWNDNCKNNDGSH